jgi:hypothetical protein
MIVWYSDICGQKYWVIFLGVGNRSEFFYVEINGHFILDLRVVSLRKFSSNELRS